MAAEAVNNLVSDTCLSEARRSDDRLQRSEAYLAEESARSIGVAKFAPHDLRRTCARLCHASGGELEQIQFLLGHFGTDD